MKSYFPLLDILRFLAAFWVMGFHYFLGWSGDLSWYRYGNLGVPLFFIISGFVISNSVADKPLKEFALGRFIRLFPLFWIACTFTYLFTLLMPNGNPVHFSEYVVSMTMLGDKFGAVFHLPRLVDAAYWSLSVEIIFYIAIALFVHFFSWKNIRYFLYGWLLISAVSFFVGLNDTFFFKLLLVRHASYFIFGATLALIVSSTYLSRKQQLYDYYFLALIAIYSTAISYKALPPYLTPHPYDANIVALFHPLFFLIVLLFVYYSRYFQSKRYLSFAAIIGGITYPLYLLHQTIGNTLIPYFSAYGTLALRGAIMMACMIVVAYFVYRFDARLRKYLYTKLSTRS